MYKILIKTCTLGDNIWNFYQEDGADYVATSLEEMKPVALMLLKKYGKKNIKIIDQKSGQDMDNAALYIYDSTDNYEELENRPFINKREVIGQLSLDDLGVQPKGDYATTVALRQAEERVELTDAKVEATNMHVSEVEATFNNYYTKEEVDTNLANIDLTEYYTKGEIDSIVGSITSELDGINAELETIVYGGE